MRDATAGARVLGLLLPLRLLRRYPQWYPAESARCAIWLRPMRCGTVQLAVSPLWAPTTGVVP